MLGQGADPSSRDSLLVDSVLLRRALNLSVRSDGTFCGVGNEVCMKFNSAQSRPHLLDSSLVSEVFFCRRERWISCRCYEKVGRGSLEYGVGIRVSRINL